MLLKNEYSDWQGNKEEKIIFFCEDGQIVRFFGGQNKISIRLADLIRTLARNGNSLASVQAIAHNHKWPDDFSEEDKELFRILKRYGFSGRFLVYYPEECRIRELTGPDS